ncbi:MAG: ROK family protein [Actinomycetota bacterium]|nr:ROK family protein [Actinomycetota bacterium]
MEDDPAGSIGDGRQVLAVDVGGTKIEAAVVDRDGVVVARHREPTPVGTDADEVFDAVRACIDAVAAGRALEACGIGCGGPMDIASGRVSPLNIPAWRGYPLRDQVAAHTGLPVFVDNDAKALARGEGWIGAGAGREDFLAMVVSTGIGAGIVLDGRLLGGRLGNAGHLGHVVVEPAGRPCACGGRGCLEAEASGTAIAQMTGTSPAAAPEHLRRRVGMLVGRAVADAANLLDLDLAVVAGSVALGFGMSFLTAAREEVHRRSRLDFSRSTRITFAPSGTDAPLLGAAALAWGAGPEAA